jgi:hypothetical protein
MEPDWEALEAARRRLPVGQEVRGTVTLIPRPGVIGLFVDLGEPPEGFVDVLALPADLQRWPPPGTTADFEVLQHRHGQVRLWPVDPRWGPPAADWPQRNAAAWEHTKSRYREGQLVSARTTELFISNREYAVAFEDQHAVLEWSHQPPTLGSIGRYRIKALLDRTQRILLSPVDSSTT